MNNGSTGTLGAIKFAGINAGDFTETNNCNNIGKYGSCTITVNFTPESIGAETATLTVGSTPIAFTGTGLEIPVSWAISGNPVTSFPGVPVGTSQSSTITLVNGGGIGSLVTPSVTGVNAGDFAVSNHCQNVPQDGQCSVVVTFTPSQVATESASITVAGTALTYIGQGAAAQSTGKYTLRIYAKGVKPPN